MNFKRLNFLIVIFFLAVLSFADTKTEIRYVSVGDDFKLQVIPQTTQAFPYVSNTFDWNHPTSKEFIECYKMNGDHIWDVLRIKVNKYFSSPLKVRCTYDIYNPRGIGHDGPSYQTTTQTNAVEYTLICNKPIEPDPDPDPTPTPTPDPDDLDVYSYFQENNSEGWSILYRVYQLGGSYGKSVYVVPGANGACALPNNINGKLTIPSTVRGLSVRGLDQFAIANRDKITEIVLPNTITFVDKWAITNLQSLQSITCLAETPPDVQYGGNTFASAITENVILYVPSQTAKSKYSSARGWEDFKTIKVIGETNPKLSLSASPSSGSVESGTKVYLTAKADGSTVSSADIYYTTNGTTPSKSSNKYTSSGISINQACKLKAIAYKDGYETSEVGSWSYTIKSSTVEPTSISVSPSTKTIEVGETFTPTYSLTPSNASTTVTWSSDDSSIASVDSKTGLVTGQKAGSTYINATTANGKTNWCTVTVTAQVNPTEPETSDSNIKQIALGFAHSLILKTDGTLWACGDNYYGQLGDGTTIDRKTPVKVMSDVAQVSAGGNHSMILKTDGTLWACGYNEYGRLGDGTTTDRKTPVKVMSDVAQVSAGRWHTMILKTDGTLWACGHNFDGQLGDGTIIDRKTPVKVMSDVAHVSAGGDHCMILKTDGTLWACGYNYDGQLGDGTTTDRKTPVKVMTDVEQVSAGDNHTMILKTDGTLWACGYNYHGQLGDGTTTDRKTPVKVMSDVAQVSAGESHTMILNTDGTLWGCGLNEDGQLGDGTTTDRKTPVKVMTDVEQVSAGGLHTMIVKTDGTLWACGRNKHGQLGDGTTTDRTSFVKIAEPNITEDEITVKTSDAGYATFYSAQSAYSLPRNLSAQVVTNASDNKLTYKTIADGSVSGVIPVGTPVMLVSDSKKSGTYTLTASNSTASYSGTNLLRGNDAATTTTGDGYHYKLSYGQPGSNLSNVFGWYWGAQNGAPFQIEGHKAWLVVPKSSSSTRGFAIGGEATGIEMVSGDDVEEADAVYYDLQGRRVTNPTVKGVYIKNGKKVMVK